MGAQRKWKQSCQSVSFCNVYRLPHAPVPCLVWTKGGVGWGTIPAPGLWREARERGNPKAAVGLQGVPFQWSATDFTTVFGFGLSRWAARRCGQRGLQCPGSWPCLHLLSLAPSQNSGHAQHLSQGLGPKMLSLISYSHNILKASLPCPKRQCVTHPLRLAHLSSLFQVSVNMLFPLVAFWGLTSRVPFYMLTKRPLSGNSHPSNHISKVLSTMAGDTSFHHHCASTYHHSAWHTLAEP